LFTITRVKRIDLLRKNMGCTSSKDTRLQTVDDSVHVMLKHDKKVQQKKGQQPHGYVPRADHPLLKPKTIVATEEPNQS
jgi:hypothetical protein